MSQQNARTPSDFLRAVEHKFKVQFTFDLACTVQDCVVRENLQDGRGYFFDLGVNALEQDWSKLSAPNKLVGKPEACAWLNPPWKNIRPWAKKCAEGTTTFTETDRPEGYWPGGHIDCEPGIRILSLFPAGVGTKWFADYVHGQADVYFLHPRITYLDPRTGKPFVQKYPKGHAKAGMPKERLNPKTGLVEHIPQTGLNDCILCDWAGSGETYCWDWQEELKLISSGTSGMVIDYE